jgi:hypothetical protein
MQRHHVREMETFHVVNPQVVRETLMRGEAGGVAGSTQDCLEEAREGAERLRDRNLAQPPPGVHLCFSAH